MTEGEAVSPHGRTRRAGVRLTAVCSEEGRRKNPRPQMKVVAGTDSVDGLRVRRGNSGRLRVRSRRARDALVMHAALTRWTQAHAQE
jgi:hypothetical protein